MYVCAEREERLYVCADSERMRERGGERGYVCVEREIVREREKERKKAIEGRQ